LNSAGLVAQNPFRSLKRILTILELASLQKVHKALLRPIMDENMQRLNRMTAAPQH